MNPATYILVHGAWHDSRCWDSVAAYLRKRGHHVHCPDLPGHGASTVALEKLSLRSYVKSVSQLITSCAEPVILVGHSMAGMIITELACQLPDKIKSLIYVSAYLPRNGESLFDLITINRGHEPMLAIELAIEMSRDKRTCSINQQAIIPLFYSDCPETLAQEAASNFPVQAALPLSSKVRMEQAVFEQLDTCYIICTQDKLIPLHHQRRMLSRQVCKTVLQIPSDHSPFYSCPEQLSELLIAHVQT